jgi:hypothetical protein
MRRWHLSALVIAASAYAANAQAWTPNSAQIAKLEASVKLEQLPNWKTQHLPSLTGYARYYTGSTQGGEQVILGELNVPVPFGSREQPGVHIVKNESDSRRFTTAVARSFILFTQSSSRKSYR